MAITNGYCTLAELKDRLDITNNDDDAQLDLIVTGVSRFIDEDRGRRFYAATETRYFTAGSPIMCIVDDLLSVTTLKTDEDADGTFEQTWTASDYILAPYNANLDGKAYTYVERAPLGDYSFPTNRYGVEIAGSFGYSSTTPAAIKEACLLVSMRVWARRKNIFGVTGSADLGTVTAVASLYADGEVKALLNSVKRRVVF